MDALHQHDHDNCGGGGVEVCVAPCLRKTRMIVLYFLISIPFIALFVLLVKAHDYVTDKKWDFVLLLLRLLSSVVVLGSFGGPILVSIYLTNLVDPDFVYGVRWYSSTIVFLGNMIYTFIYVYKHNRVLW